MSVLPEPATLINYFPYYVNGSRNPQFDRNSGLLLDIKENKPNKVDAAKRYYFDILLEHVKRQPYYKAINVIAVVPGHKAGTYSPALADIARVLAARIHAKAMPGLLYRNTTIVKLTGGGNRSVETHLNSVAVTNGLEVGGKTVLLLDDVMTSGNSLLACGHLLLQSGVRFVHLIALGRTTH